VFPGNQTTMAALTPSNQADQPDNAEDTQNA